MVAVLINTIDSPTSLIRPKLLKGKIENQDQIKKNVIFYIHGPNDFHKKVIIAQLPFRRGGCRCIEVEYTDGSREVINLADLAVVRYRNGEWNRDYWLGKF